MKLKWLEVLVLLLFIPALCYGENERFSYADFSGKSLKIIPIEELNNSTIKGSAFGIQDTPEADVFPEGMAGVTFDYCNLDNCKVPDGNTILPTCTHKQTMPQNDGEDWIVEYKDGRWQPKEPLKKDRFLKWGLSIDPEDIPSEKLSESVTQKAERESR